MRTWVYKCNATNSAGPARGNWRDLFDGGDRTWGADTLKGMTKIRRGDRVLAVQSDRHELVGVAQVVGFVSLQGARHVRLRALERLNVKLPPLKKRDPRIGAIPALQGGPIATIYDISSGDAGNLLTAARHAKASRRMTTEEVEVDAELVEGATIEIRINAYERNPAARKACLRHWGSSCVACRKDLGKIYGRQADGLIHIHHIVPLASIRKTYRIDPIRDLRPLCPNCHAVVHRSDPPMRVEDLRRILAFRHVLTTAS
jgi:5-methylcytosine-specific restriction protein A